MKTASHCRTCGLLENHTTPHDCIAALREQNARLEIRNESRASGRYQGRCPRLTDKERKVCLEVIARCNSRRPDAQRELRISEQRGQEESVMVACAMAEARKKAEGAV